ncbi:MAG TPA: Sbal_3080 family lipoprotein [Candidatus Eisenbacteria bacterium]|nr:Sbal_3080 family lipoprotein [Candidatus Eisenbacteria bacterium]
MSTRSHRLLAIAALLSACTSVKVKPVDPSMGVKHVCIENNPKVVVGDFLPVVRDGFTRHGITTEVYSPNAPAVPDGCQLILKYTALQSWDLTTYLSHAELTLQTPDGTQVASAEYHLVGKGGYALTKFQGTKTKMDPVIDELLKGY